MRVCGVICEYNPFHSGHARLLRLAREKTCADLVICVMSGEFTQRGEPAVCDKWTRARMALLGGADAVVELPFLFAASSAERFAKGAERILSQMGASDICFGAETADRDALREAAEILNAEPPAFRDALHAALARGASYAAARREAAETVRPGLAQLLSTPNNVLGTEYIRAALANDSQVRFLPVRRDGSMHDGAWESGHHPSAAALRDALYAAPCERLPEICKKGGVPVPIEPVFWKEPFHILVAGAFRAADPGDLEDTADCEPGLVPRLIRSARAAGGYDEMITLAQSRRCPAGRVRRAYLYGLFGIQKSLPERAVRGDLELYAHVLGVRREALPKFGELCRKSAIPVHASPKKLPANDLLRLDLAASDLYGLLMRPVRKAGADYMTRLLIL